MQVDTKPLTATLQRVTKGYRVYGFPAVDLATPKDAKAVGTIYFTHGYFDEAADERLAVTMQRVKTTKHFFVYAEPESSDHSTVGTVHLGRDYIGHDADSVAIEADFDGSDLVNLSIHIP